MLHGSMLFRGVTSPSPGSSFLSTRVYPTLTYVLHHSTLRSTLCCLLYSRVWCPRGGNALSEGRGVVRTDPGTTCENINVRGEGTLLVVTLGRGDQERSPGRGRYLFLTGRTNRSSPFSDSYTLVQRNEQVTSFRRTSYPVTKRKRRRKFTVFRTSTRNVLVIPLGSPAGRLSKGRVSYLVLTRFSQFHSSRGYSP